MQSEGAAATVQIERVDVKAAVAGSSSRCWPERSGGGGEGGVGGVAFGNKGNR